MNNQFSNENMYFEFDLCTCVYLTCMLNLKT